jgi:hypothetical protein
MESKKNNQNHRKKKDHWQIVPATIKEGGNAINKQIARQQNETET